MNKQKIAISIDNDILKTIDSKKDGITLQSRSQTIEYFLRKGLKEEGIETAVLLLKSTHKDIALKNIKGKSLIQNQIDFFKKFHIKKIYLVTGSASKTLKEELFESNVEIIEKEVKGNATALYGLKDKIKTNFLVMSADTYNNFDLTRMINKHLSMNKLATMGLMTREHSSTYGTAILDGDYIIDFKEKTKSISSHIVNAGIYIFKPEIFEFIQGESLEKNTFPRLAKIRELLGFFTYGEYEHFEI